jgi:hypothetical protein
MEAPTLKPFSDIEYCEKCGNGKAHDPRVAAFLPPPGLTFCVSYCPGGKEPEEPAETNPLAALLEALPQGPRASMFASSRRPRINICAGIGEEHLHITCTRCQHEFLTKTKPVEAA